MPQVPRRPADEKLVGIDEVAALVAYLCADGARSVTGAVLPIDGGWTVQ